MGSFQIIAEMKIQQCNVGFSVAMSCGFSDDELRRGRDGDAHIVMRQVAVIRLTYYYATMSRSVYSLS